MTNEEVQKTMEFILNQQAQSSAKIDGILESQKQAQQDFEQRWARSDEKWTRTEEGIRALLQIAEIHEKQIDEHDGQLSDVDAKLAALAEQVREVSENGRATDERLNVLVNTVERMINDGRNGKP